MHWWRHMENYNEEKNLRRNNMTNAGKVQFGCGKKKKTSTRWSIRKSKRTGIERDEGIENK